MIELDDLTKEQLQILPIYEAVLGEIGRAGFDYRNNYKLVAFS